MLSKVRQDVCRWAPNQSRRSARAVRRSTLSDPVMCCPSTAFEEFSKLADSVRVQFHDSRRLRGWRPCFTTNSSEESSGATLEMLVAIRQRSNSRVDGIQPEMFGTAGRVIECCDRPRRCRKRGCSLHRQDEELENRTITGLKTVAM